MPQYMIEMPHPRDECLHSLELVANENPDLLSETYWGLMEGDHYGWAVVDADSEEAARHMLPKALQDEARIAEVHKYRSVDIQELRRRLQTAA